MFFPWFIIQLPFLSKVNMKTTRRLEYLSTQCKSLCGIFVSPKLSPLKTNISSYWNRICAAWVIESSEPQGLWGFNIFSSNGRDGTPGLSAIKHLTKEELRLCRTRTQPKSGILFLLSSNEQKLYGVLWLTDPSFPVPPYLLTCL